MPAPPRIVCAMRVKNEDEWLAESFAQIVPVVDAIVVFDDGSTDDTPAICRAEPKVICYEYQELPLDEVRDKNRLLALVLQTKPDWILALDGDEVLEDRAPDTILRALAGIGPEPVHPITFAFEFLYMWNDQSRYRIDGKYGSVWHPRLFTTWGQDTSRWRFERKAGHAGGLHCGSVPPQVLRNVRRLGVKVKHFGYMHAATRARKHAWYLARDPDAARAGYYNHLVDETGIVLRPWAEQSLPAAPPYIPTVALNWYSMLRSKIRGGQHFNHRG